MTFSEAYLAGRAAAERGDPRAPALDKWVARRINESSIPMNFNSPLLVDWLKGYDSHVDYRDSLIWRG